MQQSIINSQETAFKALNEMNKGRQTARLHKHEKKQVHQNV